MNQKKFFHAVISTYRGTGRPDRPVVVESHEADAYVAEFRNYEFSGACFGTYASFEEADRAVNAAWDEYTTEDVDGYVQWCIEAI